MSGPIEPVISRQSGAARMILDAPKSTEEFGRLYDRNRAGGAPSFEVIRLAGKSDEQVRLLAVERALSEGFGWPLWLDFLRGAPDARVDIARDIYKRIPAATGLMQGIVDAAAGLGNAFIFEPLARITQATGVVYHEGLPQPACGTGFLVGPDLFLTAAHVIASVLADNQLDHDKAQRLVFRFHNRTLRDTLGTWPQVARLAPNGLLAASPPFGTPPTLLPDDDPAACKSLDFALLKLDRQLGDVGYIDVAKPSSPGNNEPLVIIGHPAGEAPRFDIRKILAMVEPAGRLRHNVNTLEGMSGSLCADASARPVGLHEGAIKSVTGELQYNRAVLLSDIRRLMTRDGVDLLLEDTLPLTCVFDSGEARLNWLEYGTAFRAQGGPEWRNALAALDPAVEAGVKDSYHPIFGRSDFQIWINKARALKSPDRVMLVSGDDGSGKSFSTTILKGRLHKSGHLVIPVGSEILRAGDLHQIAEHIVRRGTILQSRPGLVTRPAAASQRYDQHNALFDAMEKLVDKDKLLWLVFDVGRDSGWTTANDALLKNLIKACAERFWIRLVIVGVSEVRASELIELFPSDVGVGTELVHMVSFNDLKTHATKLRENHPGNMKDDEFKAVLAKFWSAVQQASATDVDRHLRCVETVRSVLQLRSVLLQSREAAA